MSRSTPTMEFLTMNVVQENYRSPGSEDGINPSNTSVVNVILPKYVGDDGMFKHVKGFSNQV